MKTKKVEFRVNKLTKTVKSFGLEKDGTMTFNEAGIVLLDDDSIIEHLQEREEDAEVEVIIDFDLSDLVLGKQVEISYEEAKELIKNTQGEHDFDNMNESTITDTVEFECVQNRKYYVTKTGKKGSLLYAGSEYETKADQGIFELEMTWDYRHPSNFAQNQNNLSRKFTVAI